MDTRFIIYFVFICLKNFELSWVVCRINKVIRMNFVELGTITAFSEIAGFCFIVSRSQSADFLLWWKETVFWTGLPVLADLLLRSLYLPPC